MLNKMPIIIVILVIMVGCSKQSNREKAEAIYDKKGLEGYIKYVEKTNKYFKINDSNRNGATPLLLAVSEHNFDAVKLFCSKGADIYFEHDYSSKSFFDYAVQLSTNDFSRLVLITPLQYWQTMVYKTHREVFLNDNQFFDYLRVLLERNIISADYDMGDGTTLLMYAARDSESAIVDLLRKYSSDINMFNNKGYNTVMFAARYNPSMHVLDLLLKNGASVEGNQYGFSVTMFAACNDNPGVLLAVPRTEEHMNKKTVHGKTALMYACENCKTTDSIEILLNEFEEDIYAQDDEGKTALDYFNNNPNFKGYEFPNYSLREELENGISTLW